MALSLSHQRSQLVPLGDLTREQFLIVAIETARQADWNIGASSPYGFSAYTSFSLGSFSEEFSVEINDETALLTSECVGPQLYDWEKNYRNLQKFRASFEQLKKQFTPEELAARYAYLQQEPDFSDTETTKPSGRPAPGFLALFIPKGGYFITPILLNLNLLVFIIMAFAGVNVFNPGSVTLLNWGANFQPKTLDGEFWRLLTSCFLHFGLVHLLMNMFALVSIGSLLEPLIGRNRFLLAYLATGLLASLASVWWHPLAVAAGASGAIFGLYGVFLALLTTNYIEQAARKAFFTSIGLYVGYNILNGLTETGIDNAAHFGGLLSGMLFGYIFLPALRNNFNLKLQRLTFWVPAVFVLIFISGAYMILPNNVKIFDEKLKQFQANEAKAKEVYDISSEVFTGNKFQNITQKGKEYWTKNLEITEEIAQLDLTNPYYEKIELMRRYSEIRLKNYELMQKIGKSNDPEPYRRLYQRYNANIRWYMKVLK